MSYLAYMLRIWSSEQNGQLIWRGSLENAHGPERYVFNDLQELIAFLEQQTDKWGDRETDLTAVPAAPGGQNETA